MRLRDPWQFDRIGLLPAGGKGLAGRLREKEFAKPRRSAHPFIPKRSCARYSERPIFALKPEYLTRSSPIRPRKSPHG